MKIALVARHATPPAHVLDPYSADQAAHVNELAKALAAQGHDVVIYARKDSPTLPDQASIAPRLKAEFITAGPQAPIAADQLPRYAKDIADHLAARWSKNSPDIVHAYHWTNVLAALSAAREHPVPVVASFGSFASAERRHGIAGETTSVRTRMEPCVAKAATAVLATTADEVAELSRLGVPNARVSLVPSGVDTRKFAPAGLIAKRKRQPRLIAVGSLAEYRRLDVLLRCLAELPEAELVIAGGPPAEDLESDHGYRILAKLAANLGIADRVRFTGHVADNELPALLRSADLLVSAARYEPQGIISIRSMACGVPVVATAVGCYRDAITDGTSGVLVPPARPEMLARRLRDLLASPMRLAALGIAAADRARSRYPWDRVARETVTVYERTIATAPERAPAAAAVAETARPAVAEATRQPARTVRPADGQPARRAPHSTTGGRRTARSKPVFVPAGGHAA
jgi:glycosyltransferase involved in cell wall biosynthesis